LATLFVLEAVFAAMLIPCLIFVCNIKLFLIMNINNKKLNIKRVAESSGTVIAKMVV
jgi:hypothetical protein